MGPQANSGDPASPLDLARTNLKDAQEAVARFVEATRQVYELLNQSADAMTFGAKELNEKAAQHADEHLRLNFALAQRLIDAQDLKAVLDAQRQFTRDTAQAYSRQIAELTRLVAKLTQHTGLVREP
jgi:hypothetical protein